MSRAKEGPPSKNEKLNILWDNRKTPLLEPPKDKAYPWSINPMCDCFRMHNIGLNCCCAHTLGRTQTWTNALELASVNAQVARDALADAEAARKYSRSRYYGGAFAARAQSKSINETNRARKLLVIALNIDERSPPSPYLRNFCESCILCQEVDAVVDFYRRFGYTASYGSVIDCTNLSNPRLCECSKLYHDGRPIEAPWEIDANDQWGITNPITIPEGASGVYFYNGYLVPRTAKGAAPLQTRDERSRQTPKIVAVSDKSVAPFLPLLTMDRV